MKHRLIYFCLSVCLWSCLDEFPVQTRSEDKVLVVDGVFSDDLTQNYLRLNFTSSVANNNSTVPVLGANVTLQWPSGTMTFKPDVNSKGFYLPLDPYFVAQKKVPYTLKVVLPDGRKYTTRAQNIPEPVSIDSYQVKFENKKHQIYIDFKDPASSVDYYRWFSTGYHQRASIGVPVPFNAFCCNRCWVKTESSGGVYSDVLVNGSPIKDRLIFSMPVYMAGKNYFKAYQFHISSEAYQFWSNFQLQKSRTGSIFDPLPAALYGNLYNETNPTDRALGYFEVSSVTKIEGEYLTMAPTEFLTLLTGPLFVPDGDCMIQYPNSFYVDVAPL